MIGTLLSNRYRLDAELGRGGMGVVYRAHDMLLDRDVAVKVLSGSGLGTEGRARLLREAQSAARLNHPNIVSVYDAGEAGGAPFIIMELVEGVSLHDHRPQTVDEILAVARQVCAALEHAHAHGIVHRDLKPENVLISNYQLPAVKLMDFGLARSVASRLTAEGALVGTVFYLAPEQALGQEIDARADLYALGVLLYELTTGRLPFTADDPIAVISQHLHAPVVPPRAHNEKIPPALDALIVRLMSKRPEDRPASAGEVLRALERLEAARVEATRATPEGGSADLPTGTVTFLFTDIEGLSTLWKRTPAAIKASLARHNAILRQAIEAHGGRVFNIVGDSFQAAFAIAADGLAAALDAQRALYAETWVETGPLRVAMGLHAGPAEWLGGDAEMLGMEYAPSHTLNRVARVMSAGHGGQILLSLAASELVREQLPPDVSLRDLGEYSLKGLSHAERIFQAAAPELPADFPPLKAPKVEPSELDRLARGRLVARERELAEATACWQRALSGDGQVLLISGEPGIGKTRLARELAGVAAASGGAVLIGECYAEGSAPYAPIAQIIEGALDPSGLRDPTGLPPFVLADLVALAPGLRLRYPDLPPNPKLDPEAEQQRIFESVFALCEMLSRRAPLLLVIDDAHWADGGTLALARHLARRLRQRSALIVLTYREVELDEARPFHEVLLDLNRERLATRIKLARLTRDQTRDLLAAMFAEDITPEFLDGIYRETEGNPFFVEEVCKALIESGKLTFADGRWRRPPDMSEMEIPQSVRVTIQSRVRKLSGAAQEALRLAAVFGREFRYDALARASDLDEDALIVALESAERAQLIGEVSGARDVTFAFAHALIPATLVEGVSVLRRRRLHRRAAEAIEALRPDDFDALAHHFASAGERTKAIGYSQRAAQRARAVHAYDAAKRYLLVALDLTEAEGQDETRLVLLEDLADVQRRLGEHSEAVSTYQEALDVWHSLPRADALRVIGVRLHRKIIELGNQVQFAELQRFEAAFRTSAEAGLKLAQDQPPHPEIVRLLAALSYDAWSTRVPGDWGAAERYAHAAVDMAEQLDEPAGLSAALGALATVYGARGLFRERVQVSLRRLALSQDPRFGDMAERVNLLHQAGAALTYVGEYAQAMPYLREAEQLGSQIQDVNQHAAALRYQAQCWFFLDRWNDVLEIDQKVQILERRYPNFAERVGPICFLVALIASVHALRGDLERAGSLRDKSLAIMTAGDGPPERWGRANHY